MASRRERESAAEARAVEMADPSLEVGGFPMSTGVGVEESVNSLHRSWERILSPANSPPTPSSSGMALESDESRPLLSRHARQIEERRQGEGGYKLQRYRM